MLTTTHSCPAGIKLTPDRTATVLWIQSPKTGTRLELVLSAYFAAMLPARMVSRITHANANGRGVVDFTGEELRGFKAVVDGITQARQHHTFIPSNRR